MTENPYETPATEVEPEDRQRQAKRVSLPGGFATTTILGIAAGLVIGATYAGGSINPFIPPAIMMFVACSVCVLLLRGLKMSLPKRLGLTLVLTVSSYVLFLPMCTAGGLGVMSLGLREQYGPSDLGAQLAVLFSCVLALNIVVTVAVSRLN